MRRFLALIVLGAVAGVLFIPAIVQAQLGIDPGKVYIDNLYPGAEADIPITVYNQNDYETAVKVIARLPDYTAEGYEDFPYLDWITITPDQLTIAPKGQAEVLVVIIMPQDVTYSGKKSEVWISFMEQETPGMIKIELCSRLLISTRSEQLPPAPTKDWRLWGAAALAVIVIVVVTLQRLKKRKPAAGN